MAREGTVKACIRDSLGSFSSHFSESQGRNSLNGAMNEVIAWFQHRRCRLDVGMRRRSYAFH
jgi:hypothetical protein